MNEITVDKQELLDVLKENRKNHVKLFKEAYEEYRTQWIEYLQECMKMAREPGRVCTPEDEPEEPRCYVRSYDVAIGMLEMSKENEIVLTQQDFRRFVRDEWEWSEDFYLSNSTYSSSSSSSSSSWSSCSSNSRGDDIDVVFSMENME